MTADLDRAIAGTGLQTYLQPLVSLSDHAVVGYEALSRWPALDVGTAEVFAYATQVGRVDELESRCVDSAIAAAEAAPIAAGSILALNNEAATAPINRRRNPALARAAENYQIVVELTERDLFASPASLLHKVDALRADGFVIALDDVGAFRDSCAALDIIRPDLVKLDLTLVQASPTVEQARILTAVMAHRERSATVILAEGIETAAHLEQAKALGADLGQGYLFGRPSTTPEPGGAGGWTLPSTPPDTSYRNGTPFDGIPATGNIRTARKETLLAFSRAIEQQVHNAADHQIVLAGVQHGRFFTGRTADVYRDLAITNPLVTVFGQDLPRTGDDELVLQRLAADDPLAAEWLVVAIGGHTAVALIARERAGRQRADADREFDFVIAHDRRLVADAARNLMARIPRA